MLTETQATAVAKYLVANWPGSSSGYLDHGCETAWEMASEALVALGYATEAPRGVRLLPCPVRPDVFPRWDDTCCVVLSVAEQLCQLRLRQSWSEPDDKTGPGTADAETAEVLNTLGLTSAGAWADAATPILWRTAPDEVRPPTEQEFLAQVNLAVADIPDDIRDQIKFTYEAHDVPVVRDHQLDWVFFLNWRWGDAWLMDDSHGSLLGVFHDPLAQRIRAAVVAQLMES